MPYPIMWSRERHVHARDRQLTCSKWRPVARVAVMANLGKVIYELVSVSAHLQELLPPDLQELLPPDLFDLMQHIRSIALGFLKPAMNIQSLLL